ncbi:LuxR C-terminal-related transcriptional regulator [Streptomyces sp. NPDC033754]|uniref:LuxR C-terminal-related transcriptional regulator n=1 Tax=unclassified Streptomyces TaxID=2593676 RepID=UPI0033EDA698
MEDLAAQLGLDEGRVRRGLDDLADLALVRPAADTSVPALPVSPQLALNALLSDREAQLSEQQRLLEQGRLAVAEIVEEFSERRSEANAIGMERLTDLGEVRQRIEELSHNIEREVLSVIPFTPLDPAGLEASRELDRDLLQRGVRMRTLYLDSIRNDVPTRRYATWLAGLGGGVRTAPTLPIHMILIDGRFGILPINPVDSTEGAIVVKERSIFDTLAAFFESVWTSAQPFGMSEQRDGYSLTSQERALLGLLATGITDEAASKRLGLSLRSVRRMMSELMGRLEAGSRFEAGIRAAERGWL